MAPDVSAVTCPCRRAVTIGKCAAQGGKLGVVSSGTARLMRPCVFPAVGTGFRWPTSGLFLRSADHSSAVASVAAVSLPVR
jgi:hypothetical protein